MRSWSEYHVGDTVSSGFGHTGSTCSSLEMFILVIGSRWYSVCPMYSWFFFTLYLINNLWETEVMLTSVFSIHWWFLLTQSLIVAKWWLSNSSIPACTSWHSAFYCKKEASFLIHPFIHVNLLTIVLDSQFSIFSVAYSLLCCLNCLRFGQ